MVSIPRLSAGLLVLACLGAGCVGWTKPVSVNRVMPVTVISDSMALVDAKEMTSELVWSKPLRPHVGDNDFSFSLHTKTGQLLTSDDLALVHEKKIHALLVRDDFTQFQHIHPDATRDEWTLHPRFTEGGVYHLYLDYQTIQGERTVLHTSFLVVGMKTAKLSATGSASTGVSIDGVTASFVDLPPKMLAGTTTELTFQLMAQKQPVQEIGPYLGAFGHVVILQQDHPYRYLHVHPVTDRQPHNGQITFEAEFPDPGVYHLYAEFNVAGSVKTFPFTVSIKEKASTPTMTTMPRPRGGM